MPKGTFKVFRDTGNPRDINFQVAEGTASVPEEQLALRDEIDRTLVVLRTIFPEDDRRFESYFVPLLSLAQAGLVGDAAQPELALRALTQLQQQVVAREGGRIKNHYMKELGAKALIIGAPAIAIGLVLASPLLEQRALGNFLVLWSGSMAGVWLSFGTRKGALQFYDLHIPEEDRLEPTVRLFFSGLITLVVGLLFSTRAVQVTVGSVQSWQFTDSSQLAFLIGVLCGVSEKVLPSNVASKAAEFLKF